MLILNGASVVERALRPFATLDAEVVVVDTGSTDGTPEAIQRLCGSVFPEKFGREARLRCRIAARLSPETHPELFFRDEASSWQTEMPGPFAGGYILRDWATARNIGLDACEGEHILKLDADDEIVEGAASIPSALQFLDEHPRIDFLMCPYEVMESPIPPADSLSPIPIKDRIRTISMYDRIWRNKPTIRFTQAIHEHLTGKGCLADGLPNWLMVAQGLRFRDWRDSPGNGVRLNHRNYKVFMREYERLAAAGAEIPPAFLLSTIGEVTDANPNLALSLLRMAKERNLSLAIDSSHRLSLGKAYEQCCLGQHAIVFFREAARLDPHSASARLALGFCLSESGGDVREWREHLEAGIAEAESRSGFNVDHRELARARAMLAEIINKPR
jgi:glycosyltransferase involved in cell wall biosynthesis